MPKEGGLRGLSHEERVVFRREPGDCRRRIFLSRERRNVVLARSGRSVRQYDGDFATMRLRPCGIACVGVLTLLCVAPTQGEATSAARATLPEARWIAEGAPPHDPASARSQASSSRDTGIEGRITIGPSTPVARAGEPSTRPYQTTIAVLDADGREVTRFATDADGRFRVLLAPGTYRLRPEARGPFPPRKRDGHRNGGNADARRHRIRQRNQGSAAAGVTR